jgi:hypothetical protein
VAVKEAGLAVSLCCEAVKEAGLYVRLGSVAVEEAGLDVRLGCLWRRLGCVRLCGCDVGWAGCQAGLCVRQS